LRYYFKEKKMAKKIILTGVLAIALVFGMAVGGCSGGAGDVVPMPPINVPQMLSYLPP
jgi:hypothetical protein